MPRICDCLKGAHRYNKSRSPMWLEFLKDFNGVFILVSDDTAAGIFTNFF